MPPATTKTRSGDTSALNGVYTWAPPNFSGIGGPEARYVLVNFPDAKEITLPAGSGATVEGTVYAPGASLIDENASNIEGNVIVDRLTHGTQDDNGGEIHDFQFGTTLDCVAGSPTPTPTPTPVPTHDPTHTPTGRPTATPTREPDVTPTPTGGRTLTHAPRPAAPSTRTSAAALHVTAPAAVPHDPQKPHTTDHVPAQQGAQQSWTDAIQQGMRHWYSQYGAHTQNDSAFALVVPLQKKDDDWPVWGHKSYPAWHDSRSATDQRRRHAHKKHKVHGHRPA